MSYEGGAELLEGLAPGNMIIVMMAIDHIFDRLVRHGLDRVDIGLGRTLIGNGIGSDDALRRHDEHRLVIAVPKDIDVVCAVHLSGGNLRRVLGRRGCDANTNNRQQQQTAWSLHPSTPLYQWIIF